MFLKCIWTKLHLLMGTYIPWWTFILFWNWCITFLKAPFDHVNVVSAPNFNLLFPAPCPPPPFIKSGSESFEWSYNKQTNVTRCKHKKGDTVTLRGTSLYLRKRLLTCSGCRFLSAVGAHEDIGAHKHGEIQVLSLRNGVNGVSVLLYVTTFTHTCNYVSIHSCSCHSKSTVDARVCTLT